MLLPERGELDVFVLQADGFQHGVDPIRVGQAPAAPMTPAVSPSTPLPTNEFQVDHCDLVGVVTAASPANSGIPGNSDDGGGQPLDPAVGDEHLDSSSCYDGELHGV